MRDAILQKFFRSLVKAASFIQCAGIGLRFDGDRIGMELRLGRVNGGLNDPAASTIRLPKPHRRPACIAADARFICLCIFSFSVMALSSPPLSRRSALIRFTGSDPPRRRA